MLAEQNSIGNGFLWYLCNSFFKKRKWKERFHVLNFRPLIIWCTLDPQPGPQTSQARQRGTRPHSPGLDSCQNKNFGCFTVWQPGKGPPQQGWDARSALWSFIYTAQSTRSEISNRTPSNGRGEQVKNKIGLTSLKNPETLFLGQFHMTCFALCNTKPTLIMEFDITWYNGVDKWHSLEILQQSQSLKVWS